MFRKVDQGRTADAAAKQIEELILRGVLNPGDRLPPERDLCVEMDVSRPVLREALKLLEERNLLTSRQGGGTFVADVIGPIFSDAVIAMIERHPSATTDYLEFRRDMEATAASHAANRASATDHSTLKEIIDRMEAAHLAEDHRQEAELDIELHQAIGEAAHNVILLHSLRSCYRLLSNGVFFNRQRLYDHPTARATLLEQHKEIVDRITSGDAAGARDASQRHVDFVRSALAEAEDIQNRDELADLRRQQRHQSTQVTAHRMKRS
ncbi:FCD domain-containing protein [uncultured Roseibium sp.]|uniref:FadR/GntR family transcriptional regulator n=1 Tax=uncultured Roseibium sp. TaxID=1936171 RepID=UPI0025978845|nr:FCD domain-containing protein [uncultured Roseibium sp.]